MATTPFYLDWQFWAAAVALLALVLSQLPPLHVLLRPRRLEIEVYSRAQITHFVGNPNVGLVLNLKNIGGRELRVRSIEMEVLRDERLVATLPAHGYFETPSSQAAVLLVPFSLKPGENWTHSVNFTGVFDRQTEKAFREKAALLQDDIEKKVRARPQGNNELVVAERELVAPFVEMFGRTFVWQPGEYKISLSVTTQPAVSSATRMYRFTIFESDTAQMKRHVDDYKYGAGINFAMDRHAGVHVSLSEHVG